MGVGVMVCVWVGVVGMGIFGVCVGVWGGDGCIWCVWVCGVWVGVGVGMGVYGVCVCVWVWDVWGGSVHARRSLRSVSVFHIEYLTTAKAPECEAH